MLDRARRSPEFWHEVAVDDFTEEVIETMARRGVSRSELARRLGTSKAYVTKLLGGDANFTLMTMVKLALALGAELRVHLAPAGTHTWWLDVAGQPVREHRMVARATGSGVVWAGRAGVAQWQRGAPRVRPSSSYLTVLDGAPDDERAAVA